MANTLGVGAWSSGTMRTEDIAAAILAMANTVGHDHDQYGDDAFDYLARYLAHEDHRDTPCEGVTRGVHFRQCPFAEADEVIITSEVIAEAIDILDEYAPLYCYVGGNEHDPANFGVWPSDEAIQEAIRTGDTLTETDRNGAGSVINRDDGVIIDVNDHGNVTISTIERGETLLELV